MLIKKTPTEKTELDLAIDRLYVRMNALSPETKEYSATADQLVKLAKLQADNAKPKVSYDALVNAGTSLLGILLILNFERANVITTKALGFVAKALR